MPASPSSSTTSMPSSSPSATSSASVSASPPRLTPNELYFQLANVAEVALDSLPYALITDGMTFCPRPVFGSWAITVQCVGILGTLSSARFSVTSGNSARFVPVRRDSSAPFLISPTTRRGTVTRWTGFNRNSFFSIRCTLDDGTVITRRVRLSCRNNNNICLLYTSPSPRDQRGSRMPSSA